MRELLSRSEILRKVVHFTGLVYIPAYLQLGRDLLLICILIVFFLVSLLEFFRLKYGLLEGFVRDYERERIGAHIYFGIAVLVITAIFPGDCCITSVAIALLGDGVAGILKVLNLRRFASVSMFSSSALACLALTSVGIRLIPAIIACVTSTAVERVERIGKYYLNDNLTIPLTAAITYELAKYIF